MTISPTNMTHIRNICVMKFLPFPADVMNGESRMENSAVMRRTKNSTEDMEPLYVSSETEIPEVLSMAAISGSFGPEVFWASRSGGVEPDVLKCLQFRWLVPYFTVRHNQSNHFWKALHHLGFLINKFNVNKLQWTSPEFKSSLNKTIHCLARNIRNIILKVSLFKFAIWYKNKTIVRMCTPIMSTSDHPT